MLSARTETPQKLLGVIGLKAMLFGANRPEKNRIILAQFDPT